MPCRYIMDIVKIEHNVSSVLKRSGAQQSREKGYVYFHGKRVAELAMKIFSEVKVSPEKIELDRIYIAGLMHDIGKGRKHHALAGSKLVPKYIDGEVSKDDLEVIQKLVREHNLRERPNTCDLDSKSVQDADALDHFGVQGVWLSVYITAQNGGNQGDMLKYYLSDEHKNYVEGKYYCLNFDISKKMFEERYTYQRDFLKAISNM